MARKMMANASISNACGAVLLSAVERYMRENKIEFAEIIVDENDDITFSKVWDRKYVNDLPDAAFALILPGGKKDEEGKTKPRKLRKLPHHNASVKSPTENNSVDLPHLRNALARAPQMKVSQQHKNKAIGHLRRHAAKLLKKKTESFVMNYTEKIIIDSILTKDAA